MTVIFDEIVPQHTPLVQVETDLTGGLSSLPDKIRKSLLVGHQTSAATTTVETVHQIYSTNHAITLWGKGSDIAVMAEKFFLNSPKTPLFGVSYAEGGAAVAATEDIVLATVATGSGALKVWVNGVRFQIGIANGDTATAVGDLIVAAINAHPNLPCTASNAAGTVSVLARTKGPHGNTYRIRSEITAGIAMTSTDGAATLSSGATEGDPTSALTGVEGDRYHIIVLNTYDDSVTAAVLSAHTEKQSGVSVQKWGIGIVAHNGTPGDAQTLATADDSYRSQIVHLQDCDQGCLMMAGAFAGLRAKIAANLSLDNRVIKGLTAPYVETTWPTAAEIEADIAGGVTALRPLRNGDVQVVRSVITRQTSPISYRDHMISEISDFTDESIIAAFVAKFQGKPLKSGSPPASPTTMTPNKSTALLNETLMKLDNIDYLQGVQASADAGNNVCEINASDPNRIDAQFDFWPIAAAHSFAGKKTYITSSPV